MSDWDDMDMDEMEMELDEEEIRPEDVFKMVTINKKRRIKLSVELRDADDDVVLISEVVEELLLYMKDKLQTPEESHFTAQIMPLMSQSLVSGLGRLLGIRGTAALVSNEVTRFSLVQMMSMSMLLLKFIQDKELKIFTHEEALTEEEIDEIEERFERNRAAAMGDLMGVSPDEVIKELLDQGQVTEEQLEKLLKDKKSEKN